MAKDDFAVVAYKILAYLYQCLKAGEEPDKGRLSFDGDMLAIPEPYWCRVMQQLASHGFVNGVTVARAYGGGLLVKLTDPTITLEGIEYLQENSSMRKALDFLRETKSCLPFV